MWTVASLKAAPGSAQVKGLLLFSSSGLLPVRVLTLEIKLPVTITAKMGLFGSSREFQSRASKPEQNHRQIRQTKERNVIVRRRRRKL